MGVAGENVEPPPSGGELLAAISSAIVGIYATRLGRGPTKARSYMNHDMILCLMEDTMTREERTLVEGGEEQAVLDVRARFRETIGAELREKVEALTGRRVVALISGNSLEPDISSELFVLDGPPDTSPAHEAHEAHPAAKLVTQV